MAERLPPPFIYIPTIANLRDAGGLTIANSESVVKRNILYRSADPSLCSEEDLGVLCEELGIRHIFDLRSEPEFERQGPEIVEGFEKRIDAYNGKSGSAAGKKILRYWTPVFKTQDYSPESIALRFRDYGANDSLGFVRAYTEILNYGGESYAKILRQLAQAGSDGVLLHCTAGKDRTGVIVALILSLLGVPRAGICQEYQLTETGLRHRKQDFVDRIMSSGAFEGDEGRASAARMVGAQAGSMQATLEMVDGKWGSAENYVKEVCGISDEELALLRQNLIVSQNTRVEGQEKRAVL